MQRGRVERVCGRRQPDGHDPGSSLIEQIIAIAVIAAVLLGLLGAIGSTAHAITADRQRTIAVSLAKQTIENLQGAAYTNVAMNLASPGLLTDPSVSGTTPNLQFEMGEYLVAGSATPYTQTVVSAGATFTLRTFVTAVPVVTGTGYRRVTVLIGWTTGATTGPAEHSLRFSSLVFPLNYATYPSSSGSAEATGASVTVTGSLGGDTFADVHVDVPGARATTNSSTLRSSIGTAASSAGAVAVLAGSVTSTTCAVAGPGGECLRTTADSVSDNDQGSSNGTWTSVIGKAFTAGSISTPGGLTALTSAGSMTSKASSDVCGSCGFGDGDGLPWAEAATASSTAGSLAFQSNHGAGALTGTLWQLAASWSANAAVDHDNPTGGGIVTATAGMTAPATTMFFPTGGPTGFQGAVKVSGFSAATSTAAGYTTAASSATSGIATVQLWDTALGGYRPPISVQPGTSTDQNAAGSFTIGAHNVAFTSRVQSQPSTVSATGTSPRADGAAQQPSLLLVTVNVTVTSGTPAVQTDAFTVIFDYGRVSTHATWLVQP